MFSVLDSRMPWSISISSNGFNLTSTIKTSDSNEQVRRECVLYARSFHARLWRRPMYMSDVTLVYEVICVQNIY